MINSDKRIKLKYKGIVKIPKNISILFWDEPVLKVPLEKLILRVYEYGNFDEIKRIYKKYPSQCYEFSKRYPNINRGIKYWVRRWHEKNY